MTFIRELNNDIVETHKSLADLNTSMAIALQDSAKWTIASRFLSGTGLWAIQNKIRAIVSVMGEYQKSQIRNLEQQQKNMTLVEKLATREEKLALAREASSGTELKRLTDLYKEGKRQIANYEDLIDLEKQQATPDMNKIKDFHDKKISLEQALVKFRAKNNMEELTEKRQMYQEEVQRMMDMYDIEKNEAKDIIEARLLGMEKVAALQKEKLMGSDLSMEIQGKTMAARAAIKLDAENDRERMFNFLENKLPKGIGAETIADLGANILSDIGEMFLPLLDGAIFLRMNLVKEKVFKKIGGLFKNIYSMAKFASLLMIKVLLFMGAVALVLGFITEYKEQIKTVIKSMSNAFNYIMGGADWITEFLNKTWEDMKKLWGYVKDGEWGSAFISFSKIVLRTFLLGAQLALAIAVAAVVGIITIGIEILVKWWDELNIVEWVGQVVMGIGVLVMLVGFLVGWPVVLAGLAIWFGGWLVKEFGKLLGKGWNWAKERITGSYSGGTVAQTGTMLVGEHGPELVRLPFASRVYSNQQTKGMMRGGNVINVNVQGRVGASDSEIRDIARKIGNQLGREINRTTSSSTRA